MDLGHVVPTARRTAPGAPNPSVSVSAMHTWRHTLIPAQRILTLSLLAGTLLLAGIPDSSHADEPSTPGLAMDSAQRRDAAHLRLLSRAWTPPLTGRLRVVRGFEPAATAWGRGHRGVDLAAHRGATVRSAGAGVVVFARTLAGRGVISVEHAPGVRTTYEPVRATITAGTSVSAGTPLGRLTDGGHNPGTLHWGLRIRGTYADPLRLLGGSSVLKPRVRLTSTNVAAADKAIRSGTWMGLGECLTQPLH
jgi:murein DD-endopeptidase MepM/ murein hydrolase activator NlpD